MKKTIRTLTVMMIAVLMLTITTIPALAAGFDFETAIAEFSSNSLNTFTLEVGKTHTPTAAVWAQQGGASCYSNDESVVTVSKDGTVTAVGEGTAYVAIDTGTMYELYCYKVSNKSSNNNPLVSDNQSLLNNASNNNNGFDLGSLISGGFTVVTVGSVLVGVFIVFLVVWMIATAKKSRKLDKATQTEEEAREAAKAFGIGGEDNVWHNLKYELDCDIYRNVKIRNGDTCSEIDAILVSESKGIFLFEIKSVGGKTAPGGNKVIEYDQLREDPSNQIYRHEYDFTKHFADINISKKIKNVLIFSWPHMDTRRMVAHNTFPKTDYDIITVEQLGEFFRMQSDNPITKAQRRAIATKLKSCSGDGILRNI